MDSASRLFSRLDLSSNSHEDNDDMDIDIVEEANASSRNPIMGSRRNTHTASNDIEQRRRRARLVQIINDTLETGRPSIAQGEIVKCEQDKIINGFAKRTGSHHHRQKGFWRKKGKEQYPVFDGADFVLKSKDKRGGTVSCSGPFQRDVPWRDRGQHRLERNGYIAPRNPETSRFSSEGKGDSVDEVTCLSFTKINSMDTIKEVDSPSVSWHKPRRRQQRWSNCDFLPKNSGSRRMVQDGCTSHYNTTESKNAAKDCSFGMMMHGNLSDGILLHQRVDNPDFEGGRPDKKKGKMILEDNIFRDGQNIISELSSDRLYSAEGNADTFTSSEDISWRRHDHTSKAPVLTSEDSLSKIEQGISIHLSDLWSRNTLESGNYFNLVDDSPDRLTPSSMQAPSSFESGSSRRNQRRRNFWKGKRKCNSNYSIYDGSSSSTFENPDTSYLQSSGDVPCRRSTKIDSQRHGEKFDPVVQVDGIQSPEERFNYFQEQSIRVPDHSDSRASQIESDEMIARQLQKQFYDEVAGSASTEEIDAAIAWSLQQEDSQQAAFSGRSSQLDNHEESMAHLYAYYAQLPYRNSSARWANRAQSLTSNRRRNLYGSEIDLETRMMAKMRNFAGMDSGMRHNFLEALEAAFDQSNDALAESHHDFDENDYEMLLALDENNLHHAGASASQIDSLPQSVVQSDNVEEACAICLENPSYGDAIRHLPCLHKFHKECIDTWLRRRTSCPICKSEIF